MKAAPVESALVKVEAALEAEVWERWLTGWAPVGWAVVLVLESAALGRVSEETWECLDSTLEMGILRLTPEMRTNPHRCYRRRMGSRSNLSAEGRPLHHHQGSEQGWEGWSLVAWEPAALELVLALL